MGPGGECLPPTSYGEVVETVIAAAKAGQPAITAFAANHILAMAASGDDPEASLQPALGALPSPLPPGSVNR